MTEQGQYNLRWPNHQNEILLAFDALLQTKTLVDVTLVCSNTSIRAHKVVLSACSPFFRNVFAENPCKHPVIVLKDFPGWVVQGVVDFMYRGEIRVPEKHVKTLIQAGESLQIRGLVLPEDLSALSLAPSSAGTDDYLDDSIDENYDDATPTMVRSPLATQNGTNNLLKTHFFTQQQQENATTLAISQQQTQTTPTTVSAVSIAERDTKTKLASTVAISASIAPTTAQTPISTTNTTAASTVIPNNHFTNNSNELQQTRDTNCTSPMPRRKQARPRRRSGDSGPHDFSTTSNSSKPSTPIAQDIRGNNYTY